MSDRHDAGTGQGWSLEDLDSELFRTDLEHFKWVWNESERELVWRVSGSADGFPAHSEAVEQAWGRLPSQASGDAIGNATYTPAQGGERAHISIYAYYDGFVPADIVRWFREAFPGDELRGPADPRS